MNFNLLNLNGPLLTDFGRKKGISIY